MATQIEGRKSDHLRICVEKNVEFTEKTTLLECVDLGHEAVAEVAFDRIDCSAEFMGKRLRAPLLISAMSGGVSEAGALNRALARAAQDLGIGFCLGSQRPLLTKRAALETFQVREYAPDIPILGNLGIQQAAEETPEAVAELIRSVGADGIALHLNAAQELAQAEGDRSFPNGYATLKTLNAALPGRVMVKETGCGVSGSVARRIKETGISVLDVSGAGGTSWPKVERLRKGPAQAGTSWLDEWGIPTGAALLESAPAGFQTLVGSGGVRSGLDAAKCLVLGADLAAMALPVLRAYFSGGYEGAHAFLSEVIRDLKSVMLLVGAKDIASLKKIRPVITGTLKEWHESRKP